MTSLEGVLSASKTEPAGKAAVAGKVVLVMQGGGAQAAYEGGVYEALHEAGIEPDWVIGTSIGAINGSIIAGNEVKSRLKRLREFWSRIESRPTWPSGPMFGLAANQLTTLLTGVPGFFSPNTAFLWGPQAAVGVEHAALYSVDPLRKLLPELVDFDLANSGKPRFTLGLVGVRSGRIRYFDSRDEKIGLDHVLGSSAVPTEPNSSLKAYLCAAQLTRSATRLLYRTCRLSRFVVSRRVLRGLLARHFGAKNESPIVSEAKRQECRSGATGYQRQGDGD